MKKIITLFLALSILLTLSACTQKETGLTTPTERIAAGDVSDPTPPPSNTATPTPNNTPTQGDDEPAAPAVTVTEIVPLGKYAGVDFCADGLAKVYTVGERGLIDKSGNEVVPLGKYKSDIDYMSEGMFRSARDGGVVIFDILGNEIFPPINANDVRYGERFSDGLLTFRRDDKYGFIDTTGNEVIPNIYDIHLANQVRYYPMFNDGLATVVFNGKVGVIDKTGKEIVPFGKYDDISIFSEGMAAVKIGSNFGYIDVAGNEAVPLIRTGNIGPPFSDGLAKIQDFIPTGGTLEVAITFIDKAGSEVLTVTPSDKYSSSGEFFYEGLLAVLTNNPHHLGFIDKSGNEVVPCIYDMGLQGSAILTRFSGGVAVVKLNEKVGVIDKTGGEVVPFGKYEDINEFSDGLAIVKLGGKWGVIDIMGNEIIPPNVYDQFTEFSDGMAGAKRDGQWTVIAIVND